MQIPLQITFHGMSPSEALEAAIRGHAAKLERFQAHVMSFRAAVEELSRHKQQGKQFAVHLDIKVPRKEIAVSREHDEDVFVAVRDAFDAARRQLEDHVKRQGGNARRRAAGRAKGAGS